MKKVAVVTDSNSGITQVQANELGVFVLPMPVFINGNEYFEGVTISQEQFFECLNDDAEVSTSQPAPGEIIQLWDKVLSEYDELVHIPMSSGLSGTCSTALALAKEYNGKVAVVDNQRISVTMRQSVLDALALAKKGKSASKIKAMLEDSKSTSSIYITVETLKYLKKGGRITPLAAAVGTLLNVKPVLQIQGGKLDAYTKVRGKKSARDAMLKAMRKDFESRFEKEIKQGKMRLMCAYSGNEEEANEWKKEVENTFPGFEVYMSPLSLSVSCHIGSGALAIACAISLE